MNKHLIQSSLGALLYPPEKKKVPWYKKKRTIAEFILLIILCLVGIIVGSVLGTRRPPPPPSMLHGFCTTERCVFLREAKEAGEGDLTQYQKLLMWLRVSLSHVLF